MKPIHLSPTARRSRTTSARRQQLLTEFDRSGLSAAAFAQQHHLAYTTFCSWRQRRARSNPVAFTEVEIVRARTPEPLVVELGPHARMRVTSPAQLELAAGLLKHLQTSC
jgi:hypothetical protein